MKKLLTKSRLDTIAAKPPVSIKSHYADPVTNTLTNGFFTVDYKWTVKYWNKSAEKILNVNATDIIGKNLWEKFAGVIPVELYAIDQNFFMKDLPVHFEAYWGEMGAWFDVITYHCDDTLSVSFKSSNHPHKKENPEQRLKTLTELYRFITEITNDCLWEWDLQTGEIFWIDGGHKRVFGFQVENALIPQNFWESRIHPEDKERVLAKLQIILSEATETLWDEKYRFQKADGQYAYVHDRGHIIYNKSKLATRMIGATTDISEKVLLENKLAQERFTKQREITEAILTSQENEREVIGNELNENICQVLATSKIYNGMAKKNQVNKDDYLEKSSEFISHVIDDIKRITKTLVIPNFQTGLIASIQNLLDDILITYPMKIEFYSEDLKENSLDKKLQVSIFRIVQEQLKNILSHAEASSIFISLSRVDDKIKLLISDNGIGCDLLNISSGFGIKNIKTRAEFHYGRAVSISKPGEGFDLRVVLQCR